MFTFSNLQFMPKYPKPGHLKIQFFLLFNMAWISLPYPLSPLPLTCDTHVVFFFFCREMYHNVCRCEYLKFQTEIHLLN